MYAIENARHEKLETPVTISVPALSTSSLYPFHSMHLVCKAPIFLQYVGRYPKIYRSTLNAQTLAMAKPGKKNL